MIKPIIALVVVLAAFGVMNNVYALKVKNRPTEKWMHELSPSKVGDFILQEKDAGGKVSYVMDDVVYKELDPVGITAQRYSGPNGRSYDAVLVAGDRMESFHDQRWCFKAQGWDIKSEVDSKLQTKSRGEVPVKVVKIARGNEVPNYAVFTFRGPTKFHSDIPSLSQDYFLHELVKQSFFIGTEYRVIPLYSGASEQEVLKFAADYIDATNASSGGKL